MIDSGLERIRKEGKKEGKKEGRKEALQALLSQGVITKEQAAKALTQVDPLKKA